MAAARPRGPLFNKPSWASTSKGSASGKTADLFRNKVYEDIVKAETRRKEKEAAKLKAHAEKESERLAKRRRISDETDHDDADHTAGKRSDDNAGDDSENESDKRIKSRAPRRPLKSGGTRRESPSNHDTSISKDTEATVIDLGEDDSEDMYTASVRRKASKISPRDSGGKVVMPEPPSDEDDEDDYTRELKRRARERAREQKLDIEAGEPAQSLLPSGGDHTTSSLPPSIPSREGSMPIPSIATVPTPNGPLCRIMINTKLPDTRPLIVNRHASQSLKQVKEYWCKRQGFDDAKTSKVFLTWRGTKLFNASTLAPILKRLKEERPMEVFTVVGDQDEGDSWKASGGGIELEAMTDELLQDYLRQQERQAVAEASPGLADDHGIDYASPPESNDVREAASKPKQDGIIIQLVCQGLQSMALRVRPNTEIGKILAGFKKTRSVEAEKTAWLVFDGDRLEPDWTVEKVGLEAEDTVEVHLK